MTESFLCKKKPMVLVESIFENTILHSLSFHPFLAYFLKGNCLFFFVILSISPNFESLFSFNRFKPLSLPMTFFPFFFGCGCYIVFLSFLESSCEKCFLFLSFETFQLLSSVRAIKLILFLKLTSLFYSKIVINQLFVNLYHWPFLLPQL